MVQRGREEQNVHDFVNTDSKILIEIFRLGPHVRKIKADYSSRRPVRINANRTGSCLGNIIFIWGVFRFYKDDQISINNVCCVGRYLGESLARIFIKSENRASSRNLQISLQCIDDLIHQHVFDHQSVCVVI